MGRTLSAESRQKLSVAMKRSHAERKRATVHRAARRKAPRSKALPARVDATRNGQVIGDQLRVIDQQIRDLQELKRLLVQHRGLLSAV